MHVSRFELLAFSLMLAGAASGQSSPIAAPGADDQSQEYADGLTQGAAEAWHLPFSTLRQHIGDTEEVNLTVYFVGFPPELQAGLRRTVLELLSQRTIYDAKPWWLPNLPKYGAAEFATVPAPAWLPPELVPPDGLIRYDAVSFQRIPDPYGGEDLWWPSCELTDLIQDWHWNNDVIYNVEHPGALTGVPWTIGQLSVRFLPARKLDSLYARLEQTRKQLVSSNPAADFAMYSYNDLFEWLGASGSFVEQPGGATLVLMNLQRFAGTDYTFFGDPQRDIVPAVGNGVLEVQYPPVQAGSGDHQAAADLMSLVLDGGLTQAKMLAAVEVKCIASTTAEQAGMTVPGMRPDQPICAQWSLEPIHNFLGNNGRRFFVSDSTDILARRTLGALSDAETLQEIKGSLFELYRYGVLQQSIKANHRFSEAYELRPLVVDLRYGQMDLCVLTLLAEMPPADARTACEAIHPTFPTEQTYELSDVFDSDLAIDSLRQFAPAHWEVNFVPFVFGMQADGTVDPVQAAMTKAFLRQFLNEPVFTDPTSGEQMTLKHPPLYRTLRVLDESDEFVELSSHWEHGLDFAFVLTLFTEDPPLGGLGVYNLVWPDAEPVNEPPYHESGVPAVKPLVLFLTPPPDGPLAERWGTFPCSWQFYTAAAESVTEFGGGGWWSSAAGNEEAGGILRRDFSLVLPQYVLGPHHGNGQTALYGVMPDGSIRASVVPGVSSRRLELGAPHWCNEFNSTDAEKRQACRDFVRTTTTLQAIEPLQHGMGYVHDPEPRTRFHYDGERSSIARTFELLANPSDLIGHLLHQAVNMYTTYGESTLWGQTSSDWNGVGPQTGMQTTLFRSHAREQIGAAEDHLAYALQKFQADGGSEQTGQFLGAAVAAQTRAIQSYDRWEYREAIQAGMEMLSLTDRALTMMGEPDRIYDPLNISAFSPVAAAAVGVDLHHVKVVVRGASLDSYRHRASKLRSH